jgi:tripartite-type tricarboxylate transporter receptor subunit TctC
MLPDVPTIAESDLPGFEDDTFNAIFAPAGTPAPILVRLHDAIAKVLNRPGITAQLAKQGVEVKISPTPQDFHECLKNSVEKYRSIAKETAPARL